MWWVDRSPYRKRSLYKCGAKYCRVHSIL
nr:unnamed protein product [Callosobruchus chinensis]